MAISVNKPSLAWLHISTAQKHVRSIGAETDSYGYLTTHNPTIFSNTVKQKMKPNTLLTCANGPKHEINYNQKGMRILSILSFNKIKQT